MDEVYREWLARRGLKVVEPVLCPTCFTQVGPRPKKAGEVKWFDPRRHYGFIVGEEGEEVFVHQNQIVERQGKVKEGQRALYHKRYAEKGPEALNVEILEE